MIPSFCLNTLTVTATNLKELDSFRRHAEGIEPSLLRFDINELCFNEFLPLDIRRINSQHDLEKYRQKQWGCISGAMAVERKRNGTSLIYTFITSDKSPLKVFTYLKENYPRLKFFLEYKNEDLGTKGSVS